MTELVEGTKNHDRSRIYLGYITSQCGVAFLDLSTKQWRSLTHLHSRPLHSNNGMRHDMTQHKHMQNNAISDLHIISYISTWRFRGL